MVPSAPLQTRCVFSCFSFFCICVPLRTLAHNIIVSAHLLNSVMHTDSSRITLPIHTTAKNKPKEVQDLFTVLFVSRLRVFTQALNLVVWFHSFCSLVKLFIRNIIRVFCLFQFVFDFRVPSSLLI